MVVEQEFRLERSHLRVSVCLSVSVCFGSVCDQTVDDVQGRREKKDLEACFREG